MIFLENLTLLYSSHLKVFLIIFYFLNSNLNFEFAPVRYRPKPKPDRTDLTGNRSKRTGSHPVNPGSKALYSVERSQKQYRTPQQESKHIGTAELRREKNAAVMLSTSLDSREIKYHDPSVSFARHRQEKSLLSFLAASVFVVPEQSARSI